MVLEAAGYEPLVFDNLSTGQGYSVREVIACVREVTGRPFTVTEAARRPGDPACLVGDAQKAVAELGWKPRHADLHAIVRTAWEWELTLRQNVLRAKPALRTSHGDDT
jgi:UDP-glucose 4-epimerase